MLILQEIFFLSEGSTFTFVVNRIFLLSEVVRNFLTFISSVFLGILTFTEKLGAAIPFSLTDYLKNFYSEGVSLRILAYL